MRNINYIVIHCTATSKDITIASLKNYWQNIGWSNVGYHYVIKSTGEIVQLQSIDKPTNGVKGYNKESIHISYIGGKTKDDRTKEQKEAILWILESLKEVYPDAKILGHRDFPNVNKACPQFDAIKEYQNI
jgi:N-acetylmuramoyl-L-alanine amidase